MKKKQIIIILCFSFILVVCAGFFWLVFHLNNRINDSLEKGWFQPPVEYYTAPEKIALESPFSPNKLKEKLKQRYYIKVSHKTQLRPGHFISQKGKNCQNQEEDTAPDHCLLWQDLHTNEFFSTGFINNKVYSLQKNHQAVDFIFLKPFLFAQYETGKPVLKKNQTLKHISILLFASSANRGRSSVYCS